MRVADRFRVARHKDHVVPRDIPKPLTERGSTLLVRVWAPSPERLPLLLVSASRKQGRAVVRNRFRRRVRMAFLEVLRSESRLTSFAGIVWVQVARGARAGCDMPYAEIETQLKQALQRWIPR